MRRIIILLFSMLSLCSCATRYQDGSSPLSITGGYGSEKGPGNLEKIYFRGNGYTSSVQTSQYAIRHAAEIGRLQHQPYFAMYQNLTDAANNKKSHEPLVDATLERTYSYFYVMYHQNKESGDYVVDDILNNLKS